MNQRPSGYEPDELPDCSTPHQLFVNSIYKQVWKLCQEVFVKFNTESIKNCIRFCSDPPVFFPFPYRNRIRLVLLLCPDMISRDDLGTLRTIPWLVSFRNSMGCLNQSVELLLIVLIMWVDEIFSVTGIRATLPPRASTRSCPKTSLEA